jgi:glutamine amidotransferase
MSTSVTTIVDYGLCNIDSIARVLEELGGNVEKTRDPRAVERADRIVLPGVGAFGAAMKNLAAWRLDVAIRERVATSDTPFLGICLGMQLMTDRGEEHGEHAGLGLVAGRTVRLTAQSANERVPHIGWNEALPAGEALLFAGVPEASDFYFVHSYHVVVDDEAAVAARTPYCGGFTSAVALPGKPVFGTQFHPEKSQRNGQRLLRNFLAV